MTTACSKSCRKNKRCNKFATVNTAGVKFIDTVDAYSRGASEEVVGRAISNNRRRQGIAALRLAGQKATATKI